MGPIQLFSVKAVGTFFLLAGTLICQAEEQAKNCPDPTTQRYTYSWPISDGCENMPRGGTTKGSSVRFSEQPRDGWYALQDQSLSKFDRDRLAILAMQGGYKVSFDFLETLGFKLGYEPSRPYQSWGTEYVYVVEDTPNFISLQHVMVMVFEQTDGSLSEPMVMKHWRQDWSYEDTMLLEYDHAAKWRTRVLKKRDVEGRWTQAVFQVDDSPRYEAIGTWQHNASFSSWKSSLTRRPLPRREFSVRDDYDVLEGYNTHVVTPQGWRQVEENWKLKTSSDGTASGQQPYLAKEQGMARYDSIVQFDFKPGDDYMLLAGEFWADVREEWAKVFSDNPNLELKKTVDGEPIFVPLFSFAQSVMTAGVYRADQGREFARETIQSYLAKD